MGVIEFKKTHESGNIGEGIRRVYDVEFLVTTDDVRLTMPHIVFDRRCPKYGDRYRGVDNLAFANDINCERIKGSKFHWIVKVRFDSEVNVAELTEDPLKRRMKISLTAEFDKKEPISDRNGLLYCNSVGDPFQGHEIDHVRWKIKVKRNIPIELPEWTTQAPNKLNNGAVKLRGITWPKNSLRVTGMDVGDEELENDVWFSELSLEFSYDEALWRDFLLNQGFNEFHPRFKTNINGKFYPLKQKILINGEPPAEPMFLDKNGHRPHTIERIKGVDTVVFKDPPTLKDIVVIERDPYYEFDFNKLLK